MKDRFVPVISNIKVRFAIGLAIALISPFIASWMLREQRPGLPLVLAFVLFSWFPSIYLTDKYRHKYPRRYYPYLAASHVKAVAVMAMTSLVIWLIAGSEAGRADILALAILLTLVVDAALSSLRRRTDSTPGLHERRSDSSNSASHDSIGPEGKPVEVDAIRLLEMLDSRVPSSTTEFLRAHLPPSTGSNGTLRIIDDIPTDPGEKGSEQAALLIARVSLNHVRRLNLFLQYCTSQVAMGGYIALRYTPLEDVYKVLRRRYPGIRYGPAFLAHFAWYRAIPKIPWLDKIYFSRQLGWIDRLLLSGNKKRNRVLSKAEAWGRLAFYGMEVVGEEANGSERMVLARRASAPVKNRKPSYYAVVALEKVGLEGERIRLHKVRSMYPFSEFLQKAIFESHGLSTTGKFKNDFRITEYGKLFRRHWIDELPGLFDWMRGDIKLVGMRATSPHFLSLYPREFYDLYIQIKPGLIPPIFDESTGGFEKIVEVEQNYLKRYIAAPVRTDVLYFWYTFRDIFLRKVRSH
jgi:hypothetical protein